MTDWVYPSVAVRLIDGDTVRLNLDLGLHIWRTDNCRIGSINAPELNTDAGKAARDFAATLLHPGDSVTFVSRQLDKYGRPLGDLVLPDGRDFGQTMIDAGHAVPYMV